MIYSRDDKPPFFFQIDEMQQNESVADRIVNGIWLPPQLKEENEIIGKGRIYCCNGGHFVQTQLPDGVYEYCTVSMYHYASMIWIAQYDATKKSFIVDEPETDDIEDKTSSGDSEPYFGWSELSFLWENSTVSFATSAGDHTRLCKQRGDQEWAIALLPDRYYADQDNWTNDLELGGLTGELGIILGLIAFSVPLENLDDFLLNCAYKDCEWLPNVLPARHGRKFISQSIYILRSSWVILR